MKSSFPNAVMAGEKELTEDPVKLSVAQAIARHGKTRDVLIPILSEINQIYGHIPAEAYTEIKRQINLPDQAGLARETVFVSESQLFGLATFYEMISTEPVGRHVIRFCESAPCHVMGGRVLFQAVKERLGIQPGETTPDNRFTLFTTSCLGTCGVGPVLLIDDDIYGNVLPEQLNTILARYE